MTQHTPGPWKIGNATDCAKGHAVCSGPYILARVLGHGYPIGTGWSPESQANARLIAAAPQLLEALTLANVAYAKDLSKLDRAEVIGTIRDAIKAATE